MGMGVRIILVLVGAVAGFVFVTLVLVGGPSVSPEVLARRCEASRPAWNGYSEDIKAIGAGPIAQWRGHPTALRIEGQTLRLTMELAPPWRDWEAAVPILIKIPGGHVLRHRGHERFATGVVYAFVLPEDTRATVPPWVLVQYPRGQERIFLDEAGGWHAGAPEN